MLTVHTLFTDLPTLADGERLYVGSALGPGA